MNINKGLQARIEVKPTMVAINLWENLAIHV